ncbi:NAD(P)/FAD-dependent oxidoreductase [Leisingera sp. ANG-Vp]|uniref:NAD(P)/FAD-dependent oxidoreductase n=1 Tax=Leisingera sp. ANG-Vp TaxID=1577896 RepID=UPI00069170EF|nr:FAD-dependent oxidoreductase [Leisingera sp. ANG-Vp]
MSTKFDKGASIAVIGAGIVGVASAFDLARRGYEVTVFDPAPPGQGGPSWRNAGQIGASDLQPLSTPGIALTGLRMMLQKDSPLRIPGLEKLRLLPWFWRFMATSRGDNYRHACAAMTTLASQAFEDMSQMLSAAGCAGKMRRSGAGFIYDRAQSFAASQPAWAMKAEAGFPSSPMNREVIAARLPDMDARFSHGMLSENWGDVSDPLEIVRDLAGALQKCGGTFRHSKVTRLTPLANGIFVETEAGREIFDGTVVAAGVASRQFAKAFGENLPLAAERGYNLTFPDPGFRLELPLVMPDRGIAITQLGEGLRIGGWAEYAANPNRPENRSCYEAMSRISSEIFPGLNQSGAISWMGNRPSLPDSIPVISRSLNSNRVFYNCGHGHYGLSNSATSARILGSLIAGEEQPPANRAFTLRRFN